VHAAQEVALDRPERADRRAERGGEDPQQRLRRVVERLGFGQRLGQVVDGGAALLQAPLFGEVAEKGGEQRRIAVRHADDRQLDRKFLAVRAQRRHLDALAEYARFASLEIPAQAAMVRFAKALGYDRLGDVLPAYRVARGRKSVPPRY
jgi:hypothetical protein